MKPTSCENAGALGRLEAMRAAIPRLEAELHQDYPDIESSQRELADALALALPSGLLERLHQPVASTEPDHVVLDDTGHETVYESLFPGGAEPERPLQ
ncbi:MAG TPA: hypothetical protein VFA45_22770 [Actinomycetes bacterium]|jgi:hypothetical protein|nr:hypothetical protein [Actinomycetes bacterium]